MEHNITVHESIRIGGAVFYYSKCSCGNYRSGLRGYPGKAEADGRQHKKAKEK